MKIISILGVVGLVACSDKDKDPEVNTTPTFSSIAITPSEGITTSTELLCVATASDEDNDGLTLSYQWTDADGNILAETGEFVLSPDVIQPTTELTCTATVSDGENNVSEQASLGVDNTAPTVSNVSISPEDVLVDSLLECSFESADADLEELTVAYSWTQNGTEVGTESSVQLAAENFSNDDVIVCTVTVEDGYEGVASDSAEVVIRNTAPVIGSTTITPENPYSYDTLTCTANDMVDLEGDDVTISYEWSINGEIQTETSNMLFGPFSVGALISCRTTPNDGKIDGDPSEDDVSINNTAPVIDSITITPAIVYADTLLSCETIASDGDNEDTTITYGWSNQDGTVLGADSSLQLDPGMASVLDVISCTATVTDPHGDTVTDSSAVTVVNTEPVVTTEAEITGTPATTNTLSCTAVFDDLNDGTLGLTFSWANQDNTELGTTDSYTISASETETGDVLTCVVSASDTQGVSIESSASIIIENTAPVFTSVSLDNTTPTSQDSLTCTVDSASDIDEDPISYTYVWAVDGQEQSETSTLFSSPLPVGSLISCTVTPNDGKIDGDTASADATVQNTEPSVTAVSLGSGPFYTNDTLTATAILADVDSEQTLTANYEWHVIDSSEGNTDLILQSGSSDTLDGAQFFDKGDSVYVNVIPNDGIEDGPTLTSVPVSISNSEPIDLTATVTSSDSFYNDSPLTCSAMASDIDPEDVALTYDYSWSTGDTGADLVLNGSLMPNTDVTCTATATDGSGASVSVEATETLANRAPTVDSVTLPEDVTAETTSIFCDVTASDLDGETPTLTYTWNMGGVAHSEASDTLTDTFVYNDVIECTVTSTDEIETGPSMTASTTVLNTAPVVDSVIFDGSSYYTNEVITATSVLSDVDTAQSSVLNGSYEWHILDASDFNTDKVVQSGSDSTLDGASHFDQDDEVYVIVTPNDGVEDGATFTSSSVTIMNDDLDEDGFVAWEDCDDENDQSTHHGIDVDCLMEEALISGDASNIIDEELPLTVALFYLNLLEEWAQNHIQEIYGNESLVYVPNQHSQFIETSDNDNKFTLVLGSDDGKNLALAGFQNDTPCAAFGDNIIKRFHQGNELQFEPALLRLLAWLLTQDADTNAPLNTVTIGLLGLGSNHSAVQSWFTNTDSTSVVSDCDDVNTVESCVSNVDLIVVGASGSNEDATIVQSALQNALLAGTPVLYLHTKGWGTSEYGEAMLVTMDMSIGPYAGNYWAQDQAQWTSVNDYIQSGNPFSSMKTLLTHIQNEDFNFDWTECTNSVGKVSCHDVTGLEEAFSSGAEKMKAYFKALDENAVNIFESDSSRLWKSILLLAEVLRQDIVYPLSKSDTDIMPFMKAYFSDHVVHYARDLQQSQPDLGTFSDTIDPSSVTLEDVEVDIPVSKYGGFTFVGAYVLAGQTITVERLNSADVSTAIKINTHRTGSTREWNDGKYDRPKFLQGPTFPLLAGTPVTISSPYGGVLQLVSDESDAPETITLRISNVVQHPTLNDLSNTQSYLSELLSSPFPITEIKLGGVEIHSKTDMMIDAVYADPYFGDLDYFFEHVDTYMIKDTYNLAGYSGDGLSLNADVTAFCTDMQWDCTSESIHASPSVQHINIDTYAACGSGCSGNPYDQTWSLNPLGWGETHEIGHNLQPSRLKIYGGRSSEVSNQIFPLHKHYVYQLDYGISLTPTRVSYQNTFETLQDSVSQADPVQYVYDEIWSDNSYAVNNGERMAFYMQIAHTSSDLALSSTWDVFTLLYLLERQYTVAIKDETTWDAQKALLGFSTYVDAPALDENDFLLIALSFITEKDQRPFFSLWGITHSTEASDQVDAFGYDPAPQVFYSNTDTNTDPDDSPLPIDGTTAWPH